MTGLLATDGLLYRALTRVYDLVLISLLWLVLSLPLVTAPAATDWMLQAVARTGRGEPVPGVRDAVRHLRARFGPTGRLAMVHLMVLAVLVVGAIGPDPGGLLGLGVRVLVVGVGVTWTLVAPWSAVLLAERDVRAAIRTAYLRALRHLPLSFLSAVAVTVGCAAVLAAPAIVRLPVVLIAPATVAAVVAGLCQRAAPLATGLTCNHSEPGPIGPPRAFRAVQRLRERG